MRLAAFAVSVAAGSALAAPLDFTIDSDASSVTGGLTIVADTAGTLIGDYDPDTNPTGTQTRPGLFGGSGNVPIPVDLDLTSDTPFDLSPAGGFVLTADPDALTFTVDAFASDLLNGQPIASSLGLVFEYDTFRTFNPDSFFLGGFPIPINLDAASITTLTVTQSGPMTVPGALIPDGPGSYTLAGLLPATLTIVGDSLGAPIDPGPLPLSLPLAGSLAFNPDGSATVSLAISLDGLSQTIDTSTLPPLPDIPFPLPTITGGTANVILSLAVASISLDAAGSSIALIANAQAAGCNAADIAEPYNILDLADLTAFIIAFTGLDPVADLDNNGLFDLTDLTLYITAFNAGCP
jgi:hypothetical protein